MTEGHEFAPDTLKELLRFRERFEARGPLIPPVGHESLLLDRHSGLRLLGYAPAQDICFGFPPRSQRESGRHRYLWVISDEGIPFIKEMPILVLDSQYPKHTNLTGGGPAYVGGELWFANGESLYISGASGRYRPIDEDQLKDAVGVFEAYSYSVTSLGWDEERDRPRRIWEQRRE